MRDPFVVLGIARRPLPDAEALRAAYFAAARRLHPDTADGDAARFAEAARAYAELSDPAARLSRLANGHKPGAEARPDELFPIVAEALAMARAAGSGPPASRLAQAVQSARAREAANAVSKAAEAVGAAERDAAGVMAQLDARWPDVPAAELAALASRMRFLQRWRHQLDECSLALAPLAHTPPLP